MTLRPVYLLPSTSTVSWETSLPSPATTVILSCLSRPCRPLYRRPTTPSLYAFTPAMSIPTRSALTPNCSLSRVWSATSAACSSALVGMHPRCRQVPPSSALSISATERFSSAARNAAAYPPLPAPRITMSKVPPFGWLTSTPWSRRSHADHTMETVTVSWSSCHLGSRSMQSGAHDMLPADQRGQVPLPENSPSGGFGGLVPPAQGAGSHDRPWGRSRRSRASCGVRPVPAWRGGLHRA